MNGIGIDFGTSYVKIVQLSKTSSGYEVHNVGKKAVIEDISRFNPEKIGKSHWVAAIQELCNDMKINPKRVKNAVSSISGQNVSVRQVTTMEMGEEELISSLEFEAKKHIPMDGTEAIIDFHTIGSDPIELDKMNVLMVASTKNIINHHNEIIQEAGFKNGIFDADPISLANTYISTIGLTPDGTDVLLNIGNQSTTLVVWGVDHKYFTREVNFGGDHFTRAAMTAHDMDYKNAEEIKIETGVDSATHHDDSDQDDSPIAIKIEEKTVFTNLVEEIRKTLRYYMKTNSQNFFNKFYLTGGSADLVGLKEFIGEHLNVQIEILNPFVNLENAKEIENPTQYSIAVGCAVRSLEKD